MTYKAVLAFWFGSADLQAVPEEALRRRWFGGGEVFDREIEERFRGVLEGDGGEGWEQAGAAGALGAVIVADQLSRNVYRGTARAFGTDARARRIAAEAVEQGQDRGMGMYQRVFLYLPFEHAEDAETQARSVALFTQLVAEAPEGLAGEARYMLTFAEQHAAIIARFGRFPGRNAALGRPDTAEEAAWIAGGGETFGQGR